MGAGLGDGALPHLHGMLQVEIVLHVLRGLLAHGPAAAELIHVVHPAGQVVRGRPGVALGFAKKREEGGK